MGTADNLKKIYMLRIKFGRHAILCAALCAIALSATAQQTILQLDRGKTLVAFSLDAALHTVHGSFQIKQSSLRFDPSTGQVSGEITVDARSGQTGNGMRDRKMHSEVLESANYPNIVFRPDHLTGGVAIPGRSSVMVHGMFTIHGAAREINVPAQVDISGDQWSARVHFSVPYAKWGMKNPSTLFLRVSDSVEIDLQVAGSVVKEATRSLQ
jgi:polyisoprenoid-binding protein YceI